MEVFTVKLVATCVTIAIEWLMAKLCKSDDGSEYHYEGSN